MASVGLVNGGLSLSDAEFDNVTTSDRIIVGDANSPDITFNEEITLANAATLEVISGGTVNQSGTDTIFTGDNLAITAAGGVGTLSTLNMAVSNFEADGGSGGVNVANAGDLTVGSVNATLTGVVATNAAISISAAGDILVTEPITTSGSGTIRLVATDDIVVNGTGDLTTAGGAITLNSDSEANQSGAIEIASGALLSSHGGNITLGGGANPATTPAYGNAGQAQGVEISGGTLNAGGGSISIRGVGGSGQTDNAGVRLGSGGSISTTSGSVTIAGTGGNNGSTGSLQAAGLGILLATTGSTITTDSGNITLTGQAGTSSSLAAIGTTVGGNITSSSGNITISGTGGSGTSLADGVSIHDNKTVQTGGTGTIEVTGTATSGNNVGIRLGASNGGTYGRLVSTGSGAITLTGTGSGAGEGLLSAHASNIIGGSSASGSITINVDAIDLGSGSVQATGALQIAPNTAATAIGLGGGSGTLSLDDTELSNLTDGFSSITIGNATAGDIDVDTATFNDPLTLVSGGAISDSSTGEADLTAANATFHGDTSPGGSPSIDTLQISGSAVLRSGDQFQLDINGTSADSLVISGTTNLAGASLVINLVNAPAAGSGQVYTIVSGTGTLSGLFKDSGGVDIVDSQELTIGTTQLTIDYDYTAGTVTLTESGNTPPLIDVSDTALEYIESMAPQRDSAATASDGEANWDGGSLVAQITANSEATDGLAIVTSGTNVTLDGSNVKVGGTTMGTTSAASVTAGAALTITFNAAATNADVQTVLRAIGFDSTSHNPSTARRTVKFTLTDNGGASTFDNLLVDVTRVNDPPQVDLNGPDLGTGFAATFQEGGAAVNIADTDASVTDLDHTTLGNLTVVVSNVTDGDDEILNVGGTDVPLGSDAGLTGSAGGTTFDLAYTASTGTLVASPQGGGTAPIGDVQTLLRDITYRNVAVTPSIQDRSIDVYANDGTDNGTADTSTISVLRETDMGDAPTGGAAGSPPNTYPTLVADNGARHGILDTYHLGDTIDSETDGQPNATATGDGTDEDGVVFLSQVIRTDAATTTASVSVDARLDGNPGRLDAWIDFNGDGTWDNSGGTVEKIADSFVLSEGINVISFTVPAGVAAAGGDTFARFRLSQTGGLAPTGYVLDAGEVEDYQLNIIDGTTNPVDVVVDLPEGGGDFEVTIDNGNLVVTDGDGNVISSTPLSAVDSVAITGSDGADEITLNDSLAGLNVPVEINAGDGDDTIIVDIGGTLNNNLTIDGGGGGDNVQFTAGDGTTINGNLEVTAEEITQTGPIIVTGTTGLTGDTITLDNPANDFQGAVSVTADNVTLADANDLTLDTVNATGNVGVETEGDATVLASLTVGGTLDIDTDRNNDGTGGDITDNGGAAVITVTDSGTLDVEGTTSIAAAGHDVTLDNPANDFQGAVSVTADNVTLADANDLTLDTVNATGNVGVETEGDATVLASLTVGGTLDIDTDRNNDGTGGDITDNGGAAVITVTGEATLDAGSSNDISFTNPANDFQGAVNVTGNNATLVDQNALDLGGVTLTGNLDLTAGGDVTDSGTLDVSGTATVDAGTGDITLDSAANDFGGAVSLSGRNVTLVHANNLTIGGLSATGGGNVMLTTDSLALVGVVSGTGTLTIVPRTAGTTVGLGGGAGTLNLSDTELARIANGFSSITIGNSTAGDVDIDTAIFNDPLTLVTGGDVHDHAGTDLDMTGGDAVRIAGTLSPGDVPTTVDTFDVGGNFVFDPTAGFAVDLDGATSDALNVGGTTNLAGATLTINLVNAPAVGGRQVYTIVSSTGTLSGTFNGLADGDEITIAGTELTIDYDYAAGVVTLTESGNYVAVIDDGDAGYGDTGFTYWPATRSSVQGYQDDLHYSAARSGKTASWTFTGLISGQYRISATWSHHTNRATDAPFTVMDGSLPLGTVSVNQELAPAPDVTVGSTSFQDLGTFDISGDTLVVKLSDDANEYVIADAVRIERTGDLPVASPEIEIYKSAGAATIIDDGGPGPGYSRVGSWVDWSAGGHLGDLDYAIGTGGSAVATYTFSGLTAGLYRVSATWVKHVNRATDAPYTIKDGATTISTIDINQELAPDDFYDAGSVWEDLGIFTISGTELTVELSDDANEYVIADGVRIEPLLEVSDGDTVAVSGGSQTFIIHNSGNDPLLLTGPITVAGDVSAGSFGTTRLATGQTTSVEVSLTGNDGGSIAIANNDADENPFEIDLTGTANGGEDFVAVIDNGDTSYSDTGFTYWSKSSSTAKGYEDDLHYSAARSGNTASWTFTGLAPGQYRVSATWVGHTNRASNAPYAIDGGAAILVNQRLAPASDVVESGANFQDLSISHTVTGTTLTVSLNHRARISDSLFSWFTWLTLPRILVVLP